MAEGQEERDTLEESVEGVEAEEVNRGRGGKE